MSQEMARNRKRAVRLAAIAWLVVAALTASSTAQQPVFHRHAAVSQEANASDVGRDVLNDGGNAIDAAVATAFALAVTHPAAGNIGGGGFIVAFDASTRSVTSFDFREKAPASATPQMYVGPDGQPTNGHRVGPSAAGVPGTVRGLALAHQRLGVLPWKRLVDPAVKLARDGFEVSKELAQSLNAQLGDPKADEPFGGGSDAKLSDFPASVQAFGKPGGGRWTEGDRLVQPDLAAALDRIAQRGADGFYSGETADLIVRSMKDGGGSITLEDLAAYRAVERAPVHGTFRGHDVYSIAPPSSGGTVLLLMLNILERYDLKADGPSSSKSLHLITEAMRRAFYHRARSIADPDFVDVPVDRLISKSFADDLARGIGDRATPSLSLADFPITVAHESDETTHLSTIDARGNAVALTYTLEQGYGSKAVVPGAGFLLNNEMGDFNVVPGSTNDAGRIGTPPNLIQPGKRMLSSQTPTIVLKDDRVRLVTGSPGGRTIPNSVLWVVLRLLEFGESPRDAVHGPRTHHAWLPDLLTLEGDSWTDDTRAQLERMGYRLDHARFQGNANTIVVDPSDGSIHAIADPRRGTSRASGD